MFKEENKSRKMQVGRGTQEEMHLHCLKVGISV